MATTVSLCHLHDWGKVLFTGFSTTEHLASGTFQRPTLSKVAGTQGGHAQHACTKNCRRWGVLGLGLGHRGVGYGSSVTDFQVGVF